MSNKTEYVAMGAKPDPFKFEIVRFESCGSYSVIVEAKYEGCKTYNGHKLMLLRGTENPCDRQSLDPHFLEGHCVIARFEPTVLGWEYAGLAKFTGRTDNLGMGEGKVFYEFILPDEDLTRTFFSEDEIICEKACDPAKPIKSRINKHKSWFENSPDWWEYHTKRGEYVVRKECYGWEVTFVPCDSVMGCQLAIVVQLEDAKALCEANNKREEKS